MNNKTKIILDATGVLISLTGFALLVADQKYIVSVLLFLVFLSLIVYAIHLLRSKPYKVKSISFNYDFQDSGPTKTKIQKTTSLVPKENNVTSYRDRGIGADGQVENLLSNQGNCSIQKEGGTLAALTTFDSPLEIGKEYEHQITYEGIDCFTESDEDVFHPVIHKMDFASIVICFHGDRRPSDVKALYTIGSKVTDITKSHLKVSNLTYTMGYKKPKRGSVFTIKWKW